MQQVKKQLQDAIAELKSGWGINEVKREDLAAVLEKVVAAVDRAAQLPVAPAPAPAESNFDKYFFRAVLTDNATIVYSDAPKPCYPAIYVYQTGPCKARDGFLDPDTGNIYERDQNGNYLSSIIKGRLIYNRKTIFSLGSDGSILDTLGKAIDSVEDIKEPVGDAGWEF